MKMTRDEIKLVTFVLVALFLGAIVRHYRHTHPAPIPPKITPAPAGRAASEG